MIKKTKFKDLFLINNTVHKDQRGYFKELIRENKLKKKRVALGFRTFVIKPIRIARNGEIRLETVTVS